MTVEWLLPTGLNPLAGPGLRVHFRSDGPDLTLPGAWIITAAEDEAGLVGGYQMAISTTSNTVDSLEDEANAYIWWLAEHVGYVHDGQQIYLIAKRYDDQQVLIDTGTIAVTWDTRTGLPWIVDQKAKQQQGGFTAEDRVQLDTTAQLAAFGIGGGLGDLVGDALTALGQRLLSVDRIVPDLQGEGDLTAGWGPLTVNKTGIAWQIVSWPPGLGLDEGSTDRTEISYGQMSAMRDFSGGVSTTADSWYLDGVNGSRVWGFSTPSRVHYYILPGVTVRAWWLGYVGGTP